MEIAVLIIAALGLIPIIYLLWEKYAVKPHKFEFSSKNTFFVRYLSPHNKKSGNLGLAFYGLKILNSSKENLTIKEVLLRYSVDGIECSTESYVLITGSIYAPLEKKNICAVIVKVGNDNVVLMNWNNLRTEIGKLNVLSPGGVLAGSALFVLEFANINDIAKMKNVRVVVIDYQGKETTHPISVKKEWTMNAGNGAVIENRSFTQEENGEIVFV